MMSTSLQLAKFYATERLCVSARVHQQLVFLVVLISSFRFNKTTKTLAHFDVYSNVMAAAESQRNNLASAHFDHEEVCTFLLPYYKTACLFRQSSSSVSLNAFDV